MGTGSGWIGIFGFLVAMWFLMYLCIWMIRPHWGRRFARGSGRATRRSFFGLGRVASNVAFHGHRAGRHHFPRVTAAFFAVIVLILFYWLLGGR